MSKKYFILIVFVILIIALRYSPIGSMITFENLKKHREAFIVFVQAHYLISVTLFVGVYILGTGLSLPGAALFTMSGGFLFGSIAALYANVGATTGATISFLVSRYLLGSPLQEKYKIQLIAFNREMRKNGARYLISLRFIPVIPFFLINILSGLTNVPVKTFIWTTSLGIIPTNLIFSHAGREIGSINSPREVLSPRVLIALGLLALLPITPVLIGKIKALTRRSQTQTQIKK